MCRAEEIVEIDFGFFEVRAETSLGVTEGTLLALRANPLTSSLCSVNFNFRHTRSLPLLPYGNSNLSLLAAVWSAPSFFFSHKSSVVCSCWKVVLRERQTVAVAVNSARLSPGSAKGLSSTEREEVAAAQDLNAE